ncbi:MAG: hypothetical protein WCI17_09810 [bacterium]
MKSRLGAGCAIACLALLLPGLAPAVWAADAVMPAWARPHVTSAMRKGSQMHLVATGEVAVAYERVYAVLMRSNILEDVEAAYLRELPAGADTNLMITPVGTNGLYYFDWKDERAEVRDVWRRTDTNSFFEGGYVMTGERYFGSFESVMNLRVQRTGTGQASFRADVFVYPHNGLIRFIFNNLLSVEDYFRDTLIEMSDEIKRICTSLCQTNGAPAAAGAPAAGVRQDKRLK